MNLRGFFAEHPRVALAFSGGADSSYLLYAATQWAQDVRAYCVRSAFQAGFELEDAQRLAGSLRAPGETSGKAPDGAPGETSGKAPDVAAVTFTLLDADVLANPAVATNGPDRCYHCKKLILSTLRAQAEKDGYPVLIDGSNADDDPADRPGFRALEEEGVLSPLRLCGLGKAEIRRLSHEAGLFTWDKPAYACLATRIPTGEEITADKLRAVEQAERALSQLGFRDFRVRTPQGRALVQVTGEQQELARQQWEQIEERLAPLFTGVELDPKARERSR